MTLRITTALLLTVTISLYYFLIVVVGRWPSSTPSPAASTDSRKKEDASLGHNDRQNTPYDPADSPRLLQEGQDDLQGINKNILVLSSTGRGGSSFLGQLITSMGATFFISEPLTPFVRRQVPLTKAMALSELRSNFLCNITESLAKSKVRYRQSSGCSQLHPLKATDTRGLTEWSQVCQTSAVRVVKTIYCRLEWITELLKDPLVKVKVVHLVRDPRAVRQSMKEARWPPSKMAICPAIMEVRRTLAHSLRGDSHE
ncbi:carbohydrate sulfotransferase 5-like [Homarus americanus]|uniref:carbohydrate sulfotransferase 5-like n=1 Tax=Homarus americanus TaxID=6706 RepID=UPI001C4445F6|nr:carbohydrate sulfotransferase 5-like [Homarus americanus]